MDVPFNSPDDFIPLEANNDEYIILRRNHDFESNVFKFFIQKFKSFIRQDIFSILRASTPMVKFLADHGKEILDEGIEIRLKGSNYKISGHSGSIALTVNPEMDWFDVKVGYGDSHGNVEDVELDLSLLSSGLIKAGKKYTILTEKDIKKLKELLDEGMNKKGELRISKFHFHFVDDFYNEIVNNQDSRIEVIREIGSQLKDFKRIKDHELPKDFNGTLRDYQYAGYNWLFFLHNYHLNGCLADDMGLGKTVQALAFLQKLKEEKKLGTSLLVVPVTIIANWESEIQRFTPELKYLLHYGSNRSREAESINGCDFVISSYHTLRKDIEFIRNVNFDYIILDESQNIKNSNSLIFKTIRTIKSNHRLSLTGTPIENNTFELWSQMEFLNSSILGSRNEFLRNFAKPIEKYRDIKATEKLKKIVYPFILRRKKEDVVKELPDKSEIVLYSQMGNRQSLIYEHHRNF